MPRLTIAKGTTATVDSRHESHESAMTALWEWLLSTNENFAISWHDLKAEDAKLEILATVTFEDNSSVLVGITR